MLVLRRAQIKAMGQPYRERLADELVLHVTDHFPAEARALAPDELRATVVEGIGAAEGHGFAEDRDIARFLNLMFTFGRHFDRDPSLGWATRLLARSGRIPAGSLMNKLYVEALRHEDEGRGLDPGRGPSG